MLDQLTNAINRRTSRLRYSKDGGAQWVTIGGRAEGDKKHAGGTPVKLTPSGHVVAGPAGLKGKHVEDLGGDSLPSGVEVTDAGHWKGSTTAHIDDLHVDPERFQYKISNIADSKSGTTAELKGVKRYNPDFGGQLLVWRDPNDGKTYVVNGHHRAELAKRSERYDDELTGAGWHGEMAVRYIPARTAAEARAVGALANIAEGRGTATDAAKFLRDTGGNAEDLEKRGVSLKGAIAANSVPLSRLANDVFDDVARGIIEESRGLAIAKHLNDKELQSKLNRMVKDRERKDGRAIPDSHVAEMAREMSLAGKAKVGGGSGGGLFGDDDAHEESLIFQRGELKAALRRELTQERNTFKAVSSGQRVKRISGAGSNQLDTETNKARAQAADESLWTFEQLANSKGELSDAIQQHAAELFSNPRKRDKILASLKARAVEILNREGSGGGLYPGGDRPSGGDPEGLGREQYSRASRGFRERLTAALERLVERYKKTRPAPGQTSINWDEQKHPRADDGKFSSGGGGASGSAPSPSPVPDSPPAPTAASQPAATRTPMAEQFKAALTRALAPPTAPLPGQRDLFDPAYDVPVTAPAPKAVRGAIGTPTPKPAAESSPPKQQALFHGLKDLPGQQYLFGNMDRGAVVDAFQAAFSARRS